MSGGSDSRASSGEAFSHRGRCSWSPCRLPHSQVTLPACGEAQVDLLKSLSLPFFSRSSSSVEHLVSWTSNIRFPLEEREAAFQDAGALVLAQP